MARYIDSEILLKKLFPYGMLNDGNYGINAKAVKTAVENTPTADAVEVDKVAEMFAEQFGDKCPCNFNDNDEWLPLYCDYTNTCDCPCKEGWKQFIKHYDKRREKENDLQ